MHLGYTRALHIDTRKAGDVNTYRFRASSNTVARDGMVIEPTAWRLDNFLAHPVILSAHQYATPLSIGRAVGHEIDGEGLILDIEFDPDDETGARVMKRLDKGWPVAGSVGFSIGNLEQPKERGGAPRVTDADLLEFSIVAVPSDAKALPMRGVDIDDLANQVVRLIRADTRAMDESFGLLTPTQTPIAPTDEPSLLDLLATVRLRLAADPGDLSEAERLALSAIAEAVRPPTPRVHPDLLARLEEMTRG
jgi:HK97 family phage prohead protease